LPKICYIMIPEKLPLLFFIIILLLYTLFLTSAIFFPFLCIAKALARWILMYRLEKFCLLCWWKKNFSSIFFFFSLSFSLFTEDWCYFLYYYLFDLIHFLKFGKFKFTFNQNVSNLAISTQLLSNWVAWEEDKFSERINMC
jgi:hypothetical protein